jgi:hypothetical protein
MKQRCCTTCPDVYVNEMTDERYCEKADGELIRLRWHKHRPEWCPRLKPAQDTIDKQAEEGGVEKCTDLSQG